MTTYEINIETLGFHSYDYNSKEIIDKVNYTHDSTDYVSSRITRFINKKKKAQKLFKILATASTYDLCEINVYTLKLDKKEIITEIKRIINFKILSEEVSHKEIKKIVKRIIKNTNWN